MKNAILIQLLYVFIFVLAVPTKLYAEWRVFEETKVDGTTDTVSSGTIIKTYSGNIYEVTSGYAYEYEYNPEVMVLKDGSNYRLIIEGFDESFSAFCLNCSLSAAESSASLDGYYASDEIKLLQFGLATLGYGPLVLDGDYGPATKQAVAKFGSEWGLGKLLSKKHFGFISIILKQNFPNNTEVEKAADHLLTISIQGGTLKGSAGGQTATGHVGSGCYQTSIRAPTPFQGNGGETIVLADGSIWIESSYQYLYLHEYQPIVTICPSRGLMLLRTHKFSVYSFN